MNKAEQIAAALDMQAHPEGGYYRETYRSQGMIGPQEDGNAFPAGRNFSTCIYFMLTAGNFSAFHRIRQDEIWHFYDGNPLELIMISPEGELSGHIMGPGILSGQLPQVVVPAGCWFAAALVPDGEYALVGCSVSPGFHFDDFELASRHDLSLQFPEHKTTIARFTRIP